MHTIHTRDLLIYLGPQKKGGGVRGQKNTHFTGECGSWKRCRRTSDVSYVHSLLKRKTHPISFLEWCRSTRYRSTHHGTMLRMHDLSRYLHVVVYTISAKLSLTLIYFTLVLPSSSDEDITMHSRGRTLVDTCWPWEIVEWLSTMHTSGTVEYESIQKTKCSAHSILHNKIPSPNSTTCKLRTLLVL